MRNYQLFSTLSGDLVVHLKNINGRDIVEKFFLLAEDSIGRFWSSLTPYRRRALRFLALPYCYFFLVNWRQCNRNKLLVVGDFLYIFFVLRYFPDNYSACRLWEKRRSDWDFYYGSNYDPFQRAKLRQRVQPEKYELLYEDKKICQLLCEAKGLPIPETIGYCSSEKQMCLMLGQGRFVAKPINGKGGHSVKIVETCKEGIFYLTKSGMVPVGDSVFQVEHIIQPFLKQEPGLNSYSNSMNTVRMVTFLDGDEVFVLGTYIRFGAGGALIDNLSQGGIAVAVDPVSGQLSKTGVDRNGNIFTAHPDSKRAFDGYFLPKWCDVVDLGKCVQRSLPYYLLLGMDIAITPNGPVLIEINAIYDNVDLEQVCGPILEKPDIFRLYRKFGLLINNRQKRINLEREA